MHPAKERRGIERNGGPRSKRSVKDQAHAMARLTFILVLSRGDGYGDRLLIETEPPGVAFTSTFQLSRLVTVFTSVRKA